MYDPKSMKAEEFIDDSEILESLKYADENKNNVELIDEILEEKIMAAWWSVSAVAL